MYANPNAKPNSNFKKISLNSKLWRDSSFDEVSIVIVYGSDTDSDVFIGMWEAREDFIEGKIGNRQFTRFLNLFYDLYPNMDPANDPLGGYGFIQSPPDVEKKKEPKFTTRAFKSKEDKKDKK